MAGGEKKNIWLIANWKSNETLAEALDWISYVGPRVEKRANLKVVVCPTFTAIEEVKKAIMVGGYHLMVGAQDLSPFPEGAYTGEEAAAILKQFVDLAILGHSERRQNFGETDQQVAQKVKQAKEHDIIPLVCIQGPDTPIPEGCQLAAYEPLFAIGTGVPDTPDNADQVASVLKAKYADLEILYGGSVTEENVKSFVSQQNLSGALVGGASLKPEEFVKIINACLFV